MNRNRKRSKPAFVVVMILFGFILLINAIVFVARLADDNHVYVNEYTDMMRSLEKGDYPDVARMVRDNEAHRVQPRKNTEEFEHFAVYYEAAVLLHGYEVVGDMAKADEQRRIMDGESAYFSDPSVVNAAKELLNP